jgi:Pilin accessory protein (PilO)
MRASKTKNVALNAVAGMSWFIARNDAEVKDIKKQFKLQPKPQSFCVVLKSAAQWGFGSAEPTKNTYSAAVLAQTVGELENWGNDWLGLFQWTAGQYWVIAMRDGLIYPTSDLVLERAAAAKEFDTIYLNSDTWIRTFDQSRSLPDADDMAFTIGAKLQQLTPEQIKPAALKPASNAKLYFRVGAGAVIFACVAAATTWYARKTEKEQQLEKARAMAMLAEQQERAAIALKLKKREPVRLVPPWHTEPLAIDMLNACEASQSKLPAFILVWQRQTLSCTANSATGRYVRGTYGAPVMLLATQYPNAVISADGASMTMSIGMSVAATPYAIASTKKLVAQQLISVGQVLGTTVQVIDVPPPASVGLGIDDARTKKIDYPKYQDWHVLSYGAQASHFSMAKTLTLNPNLRLQAIEYNNTNLTLTGTAYAPL